MKQIIFKLLLFWYATKAKFWDFCLKKVLKHHPTHQYECEQSAQKAQQYEMFLSGKSHTYKGLLGAYMRVLQKTSFENIYKLIRDYDQMQTKLDNQRREISFIHSENLSFATKIFKCKCQK